MEPSARVLAGAVAEPFRAAIKTSVAERYASDPPKLVGFLANQDPAGRKYAEWTGRACVGDGLAYELREVEPVELEAAVRAANEDPAVHGIIIYYPVFGAEPSFFGATMDEHLREIISPTKDVEGLCRTYRDALYHNQRSLDQRPRSATGSDDALALALNATSSAELKCVLPCTPLSVVKILEHLEVYGSGEVGDRLAGKTITVVNRSEVVGRPLAAMLANDGAKVYSVDIDSIYEFARGALRKSDVSVKEACLASDAIVLGVPSKAYKLDASWVRDGSVVVNVASFKNVDEEELLAATTGVRYVPLVGKVTVAMLERNLVRLYENFHSKAARAKAARADAAADGAAAAKRKAFDVLRRAEEADIDGGGARAAAIFAAGAVAGAVAVSAWRRRR